VNVWFARSSGHTVHNNPATADFVAGEPPTFPATEFNYRGKCLADGFARIGWPNTGDIRGQAAGRLAGEGYSFLELTENERHCLTRFAGIRTGDLILIPADLLEGDVHLGIVVHRSAPGSAVLSMRPGAPAYYYYHEIPCGEWYECAHRVDVLWDHDAYVTPVVHQFPALGRIWRRAFGAVHAARDAVIRAAVIAGLLHVAPPLHASERTLSGVRARTVRSAR
jgi:hypothetical protein